MTPEQWDRVREALAVALDKAPSDRTRYVAALSDSDPELAREVDSFLALHDDDSFLEHPIAPPRLLTPGMRLGPYELSGLIGVGGMGEVYEAIDTRLDRTVAIKVLPADLAGDSSSRQRLAREARAIASLSHPHICTLHEFESDRPAGSTERVDFLVMERLDGETLADRLRHTNNGQVSKGGLPLTEALTIAIEVADALGAAHAKGIVHRDLKPANIMLTSVGVKLLDFGLAGLRAPIETASGSGINRAPEPLTGTGGIFGTLPYMAPEQIEGRQTDARTDVFALGVTLHEMVAGRPLLEGDSRASLKVAVKEGKAPPLMIRPVPGMSPSLMRVVSRCLATDPDQRWPSAETLAAELRRIRDERTVHAKPVRRRMVQSAVLAVALCAVAGVWWIARPPPVPMRTIPVTSYPGVERDPALSPDGTQIAFVWRGPTGRGPFNLYVKRVSGGEPALVSAGEGDVFTPTWSPDGRRLAFIRHLAVAAGEPKDGLFVAAAEGGVEHRLGVFRGPNALIPAWTHGLSWSPDGRWLAVPHATAAFGPSGIHLLSLSTAEVRQLTSPPPGHTLGDLFPRFSPDGRTLAFTRGVGIANSDVFTVPTDGGAPLRLTHGNPHTIGLDWAEDGRSLVFSSNRRSQTGWSALWRVSAKGGTPELLEAGELGESPSVARRGSRLVFARTEFRLNLWRTEGPAAAKPGSPRPWALSTWLDWGPEYSPSGDRVAFTSHRSGASELWVADAEGTLARQLSFLDSPVTATKSWSPDGQQLAFMAHSQGLFHIFIAETAGRSVHRLSNRDFNEFEPNWSRDGQWIYFSSLVTGQHEIWKAPSAGGAAVRISRRGGSTARESPDGHFLYISKATPSGGPPGLWRIRPDGSDEVKVLDSVGAQDWTMFGEGICFVNRNHPSGATIDVYDFKTGAVRTVLSLEEAPSTTGVAVSPDGRWILYVRDQSESDIMLVEHFR